MDAILLQIRERRTIILAAIENCMLLLEHKYLFAQVYSIESIANNISNT